MKLTSILTCRRVLVLGALTLLGVTTATALRGRPMKAVIQHLNDVIAREGSCGCGGIAVRQGLELEKLDNR